MRRLLVVTAVVAERDALLRGLPPGVSCRLPAHELGVECQVGDITVTVLAVGAGSPAAAAGTAFALAAARDAGRRHDAVVSAGIAGGFAPSAVSGQIVLATEAIAADLGAQDGETFIPLSALGFGGVDRRQADPGLRLTLASLLDAAGLPVLAGPVLTVGAVTGARQRADQLRERHPAALAEAMEGFGVATAAAMADTPFAEIRTISNPVGPRQRESWDIPAALAELAQVGAAIRAGADTLPQGAPR